MAVHLRTSVIENGLKNAATAASHFGLMNRTGQIQPFSCLMNPANEILYSHKGEQFRTLYKITHVQYAGGPSSIEPLNCGENYELRNGECHLVQNCGDNATRNVEGDCHCNKNYELKNNRCVWKTDKNGFEIAPWEKPECKELDRLCKRGIDKACMQYEGICQVN